MPFLTILTNAKANNSQVAEDAAKLVAETLGKPISYVVVTVQTEQAMSFGGRMDNKGALLEMRSVGFSDKAGLARKLTDFMVREFDVEARFVNVEFTNLSASDVAIGGGLLG